MNIPCEGCLLIPICRHKYFLNLRRECSILTERLYVEKGNRSRDFDEVLMGVEKVLVPSFWETGKTDDDLPYLAYKKKANKHMFVVSSKPTIKLVGNAR